MKEKSNLIWHRVALLGAISYQYKKLKLFLQKVLDKVRSLCYNDKAKRSRTSVLTSLHRYPWLIQIIFIFG